jgi:hypothetical protein
LETILSALQLGRGERLKHGRECPRLPSGVALRDRSTRSETCFAELPEGIEFVVVVLLFRRTLWD